jgi:hypothetical protein
LRCRAVACPEPSTRRARTSAARRRNNQRIRLDAGLPSTGLVRRGRRFHPAFLRRSQGSEAAPSGAGTPVEASGTRTFQSVAPKVFHTSPVGVISPSRPACTHASVTPHAFRPALRARGFFCPCATNRRETASPSKSGARSLQRPSLSDNATVDSSGLQDFEIGSFGALEPLCGTLLLTSLRQFSGENFERRVAAVPAPAPVEVPVGVERPLPKSPSRCKSHSIWARARLV